MKIPEGWVLVPIEPTEEMLAVPDISDQDAYNCYIGMVKAASTPPAQEVEPVGFRLTYKSGTTRLIDRAPDGFELRECAIEAVYTHTADDKLRKAAEEVLRAFDETDPQIQWSLAAAIDKLKVELEKQK